MMGSFLLSVLIFSLCLFLSTAADELCQNISSEADIVLVVDRSNSIRHADFKLLQKFLGQFVSDIKALNSSRVALITYGEDVTMEFNIEENASAQAINHTLFAINRHRRNGLSTHTYDALDTVTEHVMPLVRPFVPSAVILFTDGESNGRRDAINVTAESADKLKAEYNSTTVFAVGIGSKVNIAELKAISSDGKENSTTLHLPGFDVLTKLISDYLLTETVCIKPELVCEIVPQFVDIVLVPSLHTYGSNYQTLLMLQYLYGETDDSYVRLGVVSHCLSPLYGFELGTARSELKNLTNRVLLDMTALVDDKLAQLTSSLLNAPPRSDGFDVDSKVAVLLLDEPTRNINEFKRILRYAQEAAAKNITVIPIGVGLDESDAGLLAILTSESGRNATQTYTIPVFTGDEEQLNSMFSWLGTMLYKEECGEDTA